MGRTAMSTLALLFWITIALGSANGARILGLFIHPGPSHFYSFYPVMNALAEKGHEVTSWSYFKVKNPHPNYHELIIEGTPVINSSIEFDVIHAPSRSLYSVFHEVFSLYEWADISCRDAIASPHIETILEMHRQKPFDVVLVEFFETDCALGIVDQLNIPHIGMSSCSLFTWYYDRINLPDIPSYVPSGFLDHSYNMTWIERAKNWIIFKTTKILYRLTQINDNRLLRGRFGSGIRDVADIANDVSLVLINQHYSISGPRPLSNQLIEIGGIHIAEAKSLPQHFKSIIENAKHGVVFVSWGGNIKTSSLPRHKVREMVNAFARLPQEVIWKWEDDSLNGVAPKNVHIFKWVPQRDILDHPNVKAFWSHGGNLGTYEAIHCAKPLIITPIYGDQFINARAVIERSVGVYLPYEQLYEDNIHNAIQTVLQPNVRANSESVAYEFNHRPLSPSETAVWWVEHVIATSGAPLIQLKTYEMSSFAYYSLDAVLLISAVLATPIVFIYSILRYLSYRQSTNASMKKTKSS